MNQKTITSNKWEYESLFDECHKKILFNIRKSIWSGKHHGDVLVQLLIKEWILSNEIDISTIEE